jgi:DNA repair protein RecN (Recombination protein N)
MLKKLYVKNFALIEELEITFSEGFNVITGETGAGKSLIINALNSILGERIPPDVLRRGAERAIIEGVFVNVPGEIDHLLVENDLEPSGGELILRRELHQSGRSRTLINDAVTQIGLLKKISDRLVDLHGQHEHQSLLQEENHLRFLDAYADHLDQVREFVRKYDELRRSMQELETLRQSAFELRQRQDFLAFQIREIEELNLQPGEEEELLNEERILANYERLMILCNEVSQLLYEQDGAAHSTLSQALERLQELAEIHPQFREAVQLIESAMVSVDEVVRTVSDFASTTDFDPERLEQIRVRLSQINRVKKKYGLPVEEILRHLQELKEELNKIENLDDRLAELEASIAQRKGELRSLAERLSTRRKEVAAQLAREVEQVLGEIGMGSARFRVDFASYEPGEEGSVDLGKGTAVRRYGKDRVRFLISTNPGDEFKPLARIASGGEISRIMLALKSVLAEKDQIDVLVFDEIDIGISGRIAEAVGRKLRQLARSHQIICVTHLPQIAGFGQEHYSVRKEVRDGETFTLIHHLDQDERVKEIAYLLGGQKITETTLKNAQELLELYSRE